MSDSQQESPPEEDERQIPSYLLARKPADNIQQFAMRVDHQELVSNIMREIVGVTISYTPQGDIVMTPGENAVMNLEGARQIHTFLRMSINPITTLTKFNENQINTLFETMMDEINMYLYTEYKTIDMKKSMIPVFSASFSMTLFAQLNRALDGMENKAVSEIHSIEEHRLRDERKQGMKLPFLPRRQEQSSGGQ